MNKILGGGSRGRQLLSTGGTDDFERTVLEDPRGFLGWI